jgi:hypothetical protein
MITTSKDIYMTTEHSLIAERNKGKKAKLSFNISFNKVLIGALLLSTTLSGTAIPAYAATNVDLGADRNITLSYETDMESTLYNVKQVTLAIKDMQAKGYVSSDLLNNLATELQSLSDAVITSGATASVEVINVILGTDTVISTITKTESNTDALTKAKASLSILKSELGIISESSTVTNAKLNAIATKYPTSFTDIKKGSDFYTAVTVVAKTGAIGGYNDGTFKPATNITNAKYITMLMRATGLATSDATKGKEDDTNVLNAAKKLGIVKETELPSTDYSKPLTRNNMALWAARVIEKMTEKETTQLYNIENLVTDFSSITGEKYQDAIKDLYSLGILNGSTFKATSKVTRGSAVTVVYRVIEESARINMSKVNIPSTSTEARDTKTLKWNDPNRGLAKIGDTWVDKNGKKIVLKGFTWNGITVPGYTQGIDLYSGLESGGITLKIGENGGIYNNDRTYMGQKLQSATSHNGVKFTYFSEQWIAIEQYEGKIAEKVKNPKEGDYAPGTHFMVYSDLCGWCWDGPSY